MIAKEMIAEKVFAEVNIDYIKQLKNN